MPEVAARIRRLGDDIVNAYLFEDGGEVTIVDTGVPSYWSLLPTELAAMGRTIDDVRAVLLTHGHADHIGFAERARVVGTRVLIHEFDAALARGEVPNPAKGFGKTSWRPLISFLLWSVRRGALRPQRVREVVTFGDGATLDVPGAPRVTLVPGHTPGSAALHFASHEAVCVGDAFCTYAVTTGKVGPQIAPFTADADRALASLARLEEIDAPLVLPGHGPAWRDGTDTAVREVRARAS